MKNRKRKTKNEMKTVTMNLATNPPLPLPSVRRLDTRIRKASFGRTGGELMFDSVRSPGETDVAHVTYLPDDELSLYRGPLPETSREWRFAEFAIANAEADEIAETLGWIEGTSLGRDRPKVEVEEARAAKPKPKSWKEHRDTQYRGAEA